ncbi:MAG: hypothetical protein CMB77_06645 [Euryarchaeota archaeon]|nr:hypothetical protein [Euryarchaeota archaeon]
MFEVIRCNSCNQHFGRKSGSTSAKCPRCSTRSGANARVAAIVENNRNLREKVAELNLPSSLRGQVPTEHSEPIQGAISRMNNEERVHEALRRAGAGGRFELRDLAKELVRLETSAKAEHVIEQAMEAGLIIQPGPGEWELVKG